MQVKLISLTRTKTDALGYSALLQKATVQNWREVVADIVDFKIDYFEAHSPIVAQQLRKFSTRIQNNQPSEVWNDEIRNLVYDLKFAVEINSENAFLAACKNKFQTLSTPHERLNYLSTIYAKKEFELECLPLLSKDTAQLKHLKRKLLNNFLIKCYVEGVFLRQLPDNVQDQKILKKIFMFGFGRLISNYNFFGAAKGSDFDFNMIIENDKDYNKILTQLYQLQFDLRSYFNIEMELNLDFSLLSKNTLRDRLKNDSSHAQTEYNLLKFYISIANDYYTFNDHPELSTFFFSNLPNTSNENQLVFEHLLGNSRYNTFGKIRNQQGLEINLAGSPQQKELIHQVIGSGLESPLTWVYSMKYSAIRFYDFLYLMESKEIAHTKLGLITKEVLYIKKLLNMMLVLQDYVHELPHREIDYSYITSQNFRDLMEIRSLEFETNFETMMFEKGLIGGKEYIARKNDYTYYKQKKEFEKAGWLLFMEIDTRMGLIYKKIRQALAVTI